MAARLGGSLGGGSAAKRDARRRECSAQKAGCRRYGAAQEAGIG